MYLALSTDQAKFLRVWLDETRQKSNPPDQRRLEDIIEDLSVGIAADERARHAAIKQRWDKKAEGAE